MLEEIVVTAQKRVENVQDIPLSVTAMNTEKMDVLASGGMDIRFLNARVPSLQIESSFGRAFPRFYIRGLGNTDFDLNSSQPVSLVFDEVVQENPVLKGFPVFDLDRIEILRGPQGTLFGRNSPAGIVKFDSKKPTQEFDAYVKAGYGSFDQIDIEGAVGGPLSDTMSARLSLQYQDRDDWLDNNGPADDLEGYTDFAGRLQLLWEPNDELSALFNLHGRDLDGTARVFRANIIKEGSNDFVSGFERDEVTTNGNNDQQIKALGGIAKFTYELGSMTLTSISALETLDDMTSIGDIDAGTPEGPGFIPFQSITQGGIPSLDQFTQEIRLSSNDGEAFNWQAGVFYFDEDLEVEQFTYFDDGLGNVPALRVTQDQETQAWGIFGHVDVDISDTFKISGGLRYSDDEKDYEASRFAFGPDGSQTLDLGPLTANPDDQHVSWNLSGTYFISDDVSVYSRLGNSFRAPSVQGRILFADELTEASSETSTSFEVGIKSELMENRLRLNATAFYYQMEDQQLTAVGGTVNTASLLNADKTVGFGFETDVEFVATERLSLSGGFSYNDTELQDDEITVPVCGSPCTPTDPLDAEGRAIIDGNSLPQSAEWIANVNLRYAVPVGPNSEVYFVTDWAYRSEVNFFLYESKSFSDDELIEGGVRLAYVHNDGQYEVAAYGRNITDDESLTGGLDFNNLTGFVNEPRIWGVEFTARFQ